MTKIPLFLELIDYYDLGHLDKQILQDRVFKLPVKKIEDICENLSYAIFKEKPKLNNLGDFDFLASHSLAAYDGYCCSEPGCRATKISNLGVFSALYSDRVYLPNYFNSIKHNQPEFIPYIFWSDLVLVNTLRPVIEAGYIDFIDFHICNECLRPQLEKFDSIFTEELLDEIEDYYINCSQVFVEEDGSFGDKMFRIKSDLWDHGNMLIVGGKKVNSLKLGQLSKAQIKELGIIGDQIMMYLGDLKYHNIVGGLFHAPFVTDNIAQESLLYKPTFNDEKSKLNEALNTLFLDTPIFENIPLDKIVEIRNSEAESFGDYRRTLNKTLKDILENKNQISSKLVQEMYNDILKPEVDKLDRRIKLTRASLLKKLFVNVSITSVCLGAGLMFGIPADVLKAFGAIAYPGQILSSVYEAYNAGPDVKLNELYFLWKVNKERTAMLNQ